MMNNNASPGLKSSLSVKKGLESSLSLKKTITFATEKANDDELKSSISLSKKPQKRKLSRKEILAQIEPRYLSETTISTLAKREIDKRFKPLTDDEMEAKGEKFKKLQEKTALQRQKIQENGNKLKEKNFLNYLKYQNQRQFTKMQTHNFQDYLKDLGHQYDRMLFDHKEKHREEEFFSRLNKPVSLNEIFENLKERKAKEQIIKEYFLSENQVKGITGGKEEENGQFFLTDTNVTKRERNYARNKKSVGNPFAIYGSPELYDRILKDAEKGLPVSFPGIGITKTPYYRMEQERKRSKLSENRTKHLKDLKYGRFSPKKAKIRHYSLENIKRELYEVYKYKNELEENKMVDAISKKLKSIVRASNRFWDGNYTTKKSLIGFSSTLDTRPDVNYENLGINRSFFTKNFTKITL